jgi:hypothetical protein
VRLDYPASYDSNDPNTPTPTAEWQEVADGWTDQMLYLLCNKSNYEYEASSFEWNNWTFNWTFYSYDGIILPDSITEETEVDFIGKKFRAEVEMSYGDVEHVFYSGWVSIVPNTGLNWD